MWLQSIHFKSDKIWSNLVTSANHWILPLQRPVKHVVQNSAVSRAMKLGPGVAFREVGTTFHKVLLSKLFGILQKFF